MRRVAKSAGKDLDYKERFRTKASIFYLPQILNLALFIKNKIIAKVLRNHAIGRNLMIRIINISKTQEAGSTAIIFAVIICQDAATTGHSMSLPLLQRNPSSLFSYLIIQDFFFHCTAWGPNYTYMYT